MSRETTNQSLPVSLKGVEVTYSIRINHESTTNVAAVRLVTDSERAENDTRFETSIVGLSRRLEVVVSSGLNDRTVAPISVSSFELKKVFVS